MKKIFGVLVLVVVTAAYGQAPICVSVTDEPCDGDWSLNALMNQDDNVVDGLWLSYDAGSPGNIVKWEVYLDTEFLYSGSACGCGTLFYENFITDNEHTFIVKSKVLDCNGECYPTTGNFVRVYSPKEDNSCYILCE